MQTTQGPQREIGWDGIRLNISPDWYPVAIHSRFLHFERQHRPIFTIKWQQIRGRYDPDRTLNKVKKSLSRSGTEYAPWPVPQEWQCSLQPYIHQGFYWEGNGEEGIGLLLYKRTTRRALLLQMYGRDNALPILESLVAGLRDQQEETEHLWSVFDIRIKLPREAERTGHEFLPGSFRLHFSLAGQSVTYYRFKPAAELLRRQSLHDFGRKITKEGTLERVDEPVFIQWRQFSAPGGFLARLRRKPASSRTRLWQIPKHNVILGLKVRGAQPMSDHQFEQLCSGYSAC